MSHALTLNSNFVALSSQWIQLQSFDWIKQSLTPYPTL